MTQVLESRTSPGGWVLFVVLAGIALAVGLTAMALIMARDNARQVPTGGVPAGLTSQAGSNS